MLVTANLALSVVVPPRAKSKVSLIGDRRLELTCQYEVIPVAPAHDVHEGAPAPPETRHSPESPAASESYAFAPVE